MHDDNQYILSLIIADLEKEIEPLETKRAKAHAAQLASLDDCIKAKL
jgi:hypothetical protein